MARSSGGEEEIICTSKGGKDERINYDTDGKS